MVVRNSILLSYVSLPNITLEHLGKKRSMLNELVDTLALYVVLFELSHFTLNARMYTRTPTSTPTQIFSNT